MDSGANFQTGEEFNKRDANRGELPEELTALVCGSIILHSSSVDPLFVERNGKPWQSHVQIKRRRLLRRVKQTVKFRLRLRRRGPRRQRRTKRRLRCTGRKRSTSGRPQDSWRRRT